MPILPHIGATPFRAAQGDAAEARFDARRSLIVEEANDIGTTYLRAQLLTEPERGESLALLKDYTDAAIDLADAVLPNLKADTGFDRAAFNELARALLGLRTSDAGLEFAPIGCREELVALSESYKRVAGYDKERLKTPA